MQPGSIGQDPYRIAADTWIIPQIEPVGPGLFASINSMVISGSEPVIVDTGCAVNRQRWLNQVFSLVDPDDVRWVFLSHGDRDHVGNADAVMSLCGNATLVTTLWGVKYLLADGLPPLDRMRWVNDGERFDAGRRSLCAVCPPTWDGANTRGLFDPLTGVYWAADSFGSYITQPVTSAAELDHGFWVDSLLHEGRSATAWLNLVDPARFSALVQRSAGLDPKVVASAHGPVLTGPMVGEAYRLVQRMAGMEPVAPDGQATLDAMVALVAALQPDAA
jgi:flavorubredoxin